MPGMVVRGLKLDNGVHWSHGHGSPQQELGFCHSRISVLMANVDLRTGRGESLRRGGYLPPLIMFSPQHLCALGAYWKSLLLSGVPVPVKPLAHLS